MAPRAAGVHTHEEWKGMAQPVGLVVEPVVLNRLGIFPESATTVLADWQQRLEQLLEDQVLFSQFICLSLGLLPLTLPICNSLSLIIGVSQSLIISHFKHFLNSFLFDSGLFLLSLNLSICPKIGKFCHTVQL